MAIGGTTLEYHKASTTSLQVMQTASRQPFGFWTAMSLKSREPMTHHTQHSCRRSQTVLEE